MFDEVYTVFNAQHVSDVNTSILRGLRLICWVISWVVLLYCVIVKLPHWWYCSWFIWSWVGVVSVLQTSARNTDTTPTQPHRNSNTYRTKNNMTNVVIQQNSRKLLMMDILLSETCSAHMKRNKIASDIKLVFYSSTITMMHGPVNIRSYHSL